MPKTERLPKGATLDRQEAERIVSDKDPLTPGTAYTYWNTVLSELGEHVFDGLDQAETPAMRFARALPHDRIDKLLKGRPPVLGSTDDVHVLKEAGCAMSTDEVAQSIRPGADTRALFEDLQAFRDVTSSNQPPRSGTTLSPAARGLIAARELYDITRRFVFARSNAEAFDLSVAECLALHRAEGAFAVTPPEASFPYGPLVRTGSIGCRTNRVLHSINTPDRPDRVERPGFALVIPIKEYFQRLEREENLTESSLVQVMLTVNLLITGGLDIIVGWIPEDFDELQLLVYNAQARPHLKEFQQKLGLPAVGPPALTGTEIFHVVYRLTANIIMTQIEFADELPNANEIIANGLEEMNALLASHRVQVRRRGARTDVHLLGDSRGIDTMMCLRTQCRWYAACKKPSTLLARRDRVGKLARIDLFSPFMAYLRFHTGDPLFMQILLRTFLRLKPLYQRATTKGMRRRTGRWGDDFVAALKAAKWSALSAKEKTQLKQDVEYWTRHVKDKRQQRVKPMWRHLGLLATLEKQPDAPLWPDVALTPTVYWPKQDREAYEVLEEAAAIVKRNLTLIEGQRLLPALSLALETIPIDTLIDARALPGRSRATVAKAHNFERLRLVYQQAWDNASPRLP